MTGERHKHEWLDSETGWRICTRCVLVQRHDGTRWRNAPKVVQDYMRMNLFLALVHEIVSHSDEIARMLGRFGDTFKVMMRP